jgi:hypothetical protein
MISYSYHPSHSPQLRWSNSHFFALSWSWMLPCSQTEPCPRNITDMISHTMLLLRFSFVLEGTNQRVKASLHESILAQFLHPSNASLTFCLSNATHKMVCTDHCLPSMPQKHPVQGVPTKHTAPSRGFQPCVARKAKASSRVKVCT